MAVLVRLENEMPPVLIPPYSLGRDTPVSEVMKAACDFYRQDPATAKLWNTLTGVEIPVDQRPLHEHGLGDWSLLTLGLTPGRPYRRTSFG
jgi:hypothetical protein